jgi:hypothetical protein
MTHEMPRIIRVMAAGRENPGLVRVVAVWVLLPRSG